MTVVNCPHCGAVLKNIPKSSRSTCPKCVSMETYPQVTWEMKRNAREAKHQAERAVLPTATPLRCIGKSGVVWRKLSDRPGIFTHCQKADRGSVRVKTPIGGLMYVSRDLSIEAELEDALGVVSMEAFDQLCQACLHRNIDQQAVIVRDWVLKQNKGDAECPNQFS
jgi:hypothetical protein